MRIDDGVREGGVISPFYDSMIAKLIVHGATREEALARLDEALAATHIVGMSTNVQFLRHVVRSRSFAEADLDTLRLIAEYLRDDFRVRRAIRRTRTTAGPSSSTRTVAVPLRMIICGVGAAVSACVTMSDPLVLRSTSSPSARIRAARRAASRTRSAASAASRCSRVSSSTGPTLAGGVLWQDGATQASY